MMHDVRDLIDRFSGQITDRRFGPDGEELLSSKIRRAAMAIAAQKRAEEEDPNLREQRLKRASENEAKARAERCRLFEERMAAETPGALRAMGLEDREMNDVAAMDDGWPAWQQVRDWLATTGNSIVIGGDTGTGKTVAAARVLMEKCRTFLNSESIEGWYWEPGWGRFVKTAELAKLSYYSRDDRKWFERIAHRKWLVLDDLGSESMSDPWKATLLELIDGRQRRGLRTVITLNLRGEKLADRYDTRLVRRLKDYGRFAVAKKPEAANT